MSDHCGTSHQTDPMLNSARRHFLGFSAALAASALGGCARLHDNVDPNDARLSVLAGFLDMSQAPSSLQWVSIKAYGASTDHFFKTRVEGGVFFHVGIDPGAYQVDRFGGQGGIPLLTARPYEYEWGAQGSNESAVRVQEPGVYFLGAYQYVPKQTGVFEPGRFSMKRITKPSEKDVLQRSLAVIEGDSVLRRYTLQIDRLRRRIASLPA